MMALAKRLLLGRALGTRAGRRLMVIGGVAASSILVLVQLAAYRNVTGSVRTYVSQPGIDLWVAPRGTDNLVRSSGLMDAEEVAQLRQLPGVAAAHRILRVFVSVTRDDGASIQDGRRPLHLLGIGYQSPAGLAGPPRFVAGRAPRGEHEVALDRTAARSLGVGLGDRVLVNQRRTRVVGLTGETNLLATQFVFFDLEAAENATGFFGDASFVALRLQPGRSEAGTRRLIERRLEDVSAFTRAAFVDSSVREAAAGFLPLLALITGIGLTMTLVLVALLLQAAVEARRGQIAVLLALGAAPVRLALAVLRQSLTLVLVGGVLGAAAALGLALLLDLRCSVVQLAFRAGDVALVLGLFGLAGALAALTPLLRLSRVDPLEAFRQ
jgi:ABC-type lipoprotein release transport system permease subunit